MEALEDFEDIIRHEDLPRWSKEDQRLKRLHQIFEGYPYPSNSPTPPFPSVSRVCEVLGRLEGKERLEVVLNYLIDLLIRSGYLLDKQMNTLEEKHTKEGGYNENLLKRRLDYRRSRR